jgi:hypothetical protein
MSSSDIDFAILSSGNDVENGNNLYYDPYMVGTYLAEIKLAVA